MKRSTIIILVGVVLVILGLMAKYGIADGISGTLHAFDDGRVVKCNVAIDAQLDGDLMIEDGTACDAVKSCKVNVFRSLSITDYLGFVNGEVLLTQSGTVYDRADVQESRFGGADFYGLQACIPADATQVRIMVKNTDGGVTDEAIVTIN